MPEFPTAALSHRFGVFFFTAGAIANPVDFRFQKVSGLAAEIDVVSRKEGGQQLYEHRLPNGASYGVLHLERGFAVASPLNIEFQLAFSAMQFLPGNAIVTLFAESGVPLRAWTFIKTYPVKWSTSELDATDSDVVIDTLELAYTRMQQVVV